MEAAQREKKIMGKRKEMHDIDNKIDRLNAQIRELTDAKGLIRLDIYNLHNNSQNNASEKKIHYAVSC